MCSVVLVCDGVFCFVLMCSVIFWCVGVCHCALVCSAVCWCVVMCSSALLFNELDFYSASSLKQQSAGRHVALHKDALS